ncbi:Uncharacterised protein [Burkholderia pseudomallei]|nr:Uncharacterised protein [Burkholderia pseudomallei]CAJ3335921.1 Uncharacterised protein [Burkholderia pseudomallei]CAJ3340924.1 Uncharacterised protein [Burkholderia pseudomallei]CAJ3354629.1 Uncharacterised protein [Burkholderia pseudomallei]CAJ4126705.1 Uncharacterised protein [Burkholderia pseudomallei]
MQQLPPDLGQCFFFCALRRFVFGASVCVVRRRGQCAPVQLAVRRQRPRVQPHIRRRHHVARQVLRGLRSQCRDIGIARVVRDEAFLGRRRGLGRGRIWRCVIAHLRCRITRKHDHFAHPRHLRQLRLDLSQLDPESAYLHLEVVSPQILQTPVRAPTRQIPRLIQPPTRHERIVDEPLPRQLRPVQIPACDTRPAHIQLSRHAHRHRLATIIQHVQLQIRNPHADRTRTQTHGVFRSQRTIRHVHRRLGDSIHVHQLRTLAVTGIPRRERPRLQRLSTEDDIAQPVGDYVCALDIPGRLRFRVYIRL